jgi:hypothetical protein
MSAIVFDAIAAEIALLTPLVPTPVEPYGYGTDLSCVSDVTETLEEVDPESALGVAQAAARRLTTARGSLPDDPDYGLDVRGYLNRGVSSREYVDFAGQIKLELLKDDRIEDAAVTVIAPDTTSLSVQVRLTPFDPSLQPFAFTLAVTSSEVLLELEATV